MKRISWGLVSLFVVVACSSGSGDGGSGGSGGSGGDCNSTPCFAPAQCVQQCGETPVDYGCCGCPSGWIDVSSCPADAASDASCAPALADAGNVACGSETCGPTQICVNPCCGGAQLPDGEACKPPPPFCAEASEVSCCGGGSTCMHPSGCSGMLSGQALACLCA